MTAMTCACRSFLLCALLAPGLVAASVQSGDPAKPALVLDGDSAVITILIHPDKALDFERIIGRLTAALQNSKKPLRRAQAAGWRTFKSLEAAQGNAVYVMRIDPVVRGQEYDITRIIAEEFPDEVVGLHQKYQAAFAGRVITVLNGLAIDGLGGKGISERIGAPLRELPQSPLLLSLNADAAMITVLIRPEKSADFEAALALLGKSLQMSSKPARREQAVGWKVSKAKEPINGNVAYVMNIDPVVHNQEYDLIRLLGETHQSQIQEIFQAYKAAFVGRAIVRLAPIATPAP